MRRLVAGIAARTTSAHVIAMVALVVALGGTSYAAVTISGRNVKNGSLSGADIKDNSIRGKDVRNSSLATRDVKNGSLLKRDFKSGQLPTGKQGPQGPQGAAGAPGPRGSAKAWALVSNTGTVVRGFGLSQAKVKRAGTGSYCIDASPFTTRNAVAVATIDFSDPKATTQRIYVANQVSKAPDIYNACPDGSFEVDTIDSAGQAADTGFVFAIP